MKCERCDSVSLDIKTWKFNANENVVDLCTKCARKLIDIEQSIIDDARNKFEEQFNIFISGEKK